MCQGKEDLAVSPGGLDRGELAGEVGPVLQGFELGLGVGVVVADVGPAQGAADAELAE